MQTTSGTWKITGSVDVDWRRKVAVSEGRLLVTGGALTSRTTGGSVFTHHTVVHADASEPSAVSTARACKLCEPSSSPRTVSVCDATSNDIDDADGSVNTSDHDAAPSRRTCSDSSDGVCRQ